MYKKNDIIFMKKPLRNVIKRIKQRSPAIRPAGLSPGYLHEISAEKNICSNIQLIRYNNTSSEEFTSLSEEQMVERKDLDKSFMYWYNIDGIENTKQLETIGKKYNIHSLVLEDIVMSNQRPKVEVYEDTLFFVIRMFRLCNQEIVSEQVSFLVGSGFLLSFQELGMEGDCFDPNRKRIRDLNSRHRKFGTDYLLYTLVDTIIDHYFIVLEHINLQLDGIEEQILNENNSNALQQLYSIRNQMNEIKKYSWPLREIVAKLIRDEEKLINDKIKVYLRDVYDHSIQVIDTIESNRDLISSMIDLQLSMVNNKMNAVMKVLTLISTIFIPLSFIVGLYGMNFDYIPELHFKHGYFYVLSLCFTVTISMVVFFRFKKWI
jgi:magnesium transporter